VKKQVVAAVAAVLLAALGVLSLVSYANGANDRAFEGAKLVPVLRLRADVPAGTPVERLAASVELAKVPASAKVDGALTSLDTVKGKSTNAPLMKGEQVLATRFGGAAAGAKKVSSAVPKGMQQVTISVSGSRTPTGKVKPGDRVGVMASYTDSKGEGAAGFTNLAVSNVLVTKVTSAVVGDATEGAASLVTFAVKTVDAEKIVNASEFGKVWLTLQGEDADTGGGRTISGKDVLK
jgi:pilus assembly protein CpaB